MTHGNRLVLPSERKVRITVTHLWHSVLVSELARALHTLVIDFTDILTYQVLAATAVFSLVAEQVIDPALTTALGL